MKTIIIALDPSGNYYEGRGVTGYCIYNAVDNCFITCGSILAKDFDCAEAYWDTVIDFLDWATKVYQDSIIVCEDYLLYANRATSQINSRMETPKLLGVIQYWCYQHEIQYCMQTAVEVKTRWTNEILAHKGYIEAYGKSWTPTSGDNKTYTHHSLDAIRHAIHYNTFKNRS